MCNLSTYSIHNNARHQSTRGYGTYHVRMRDLIGSPRTSFKIPLHGNLYIAQWVPVEVPGFPMNSSSQGSPHNSRDLMESRKIFHGLHFERPLHHQEVVESSIRMDVMWYSHDIPFSRHHTKNFYSFNLHRDWRLCPLHLVNIYCYITMMCNKSNYKL